MSVSSRVYVVIYVCVHMLYTQVKIEYVRICTYTYEFVRVCIPVYVHVPMRECLYACAWVLTYVYVHVRMRTHYFMFRTHMHITCFRFKQLVSGLWGVRGLLSQCMHCHMLADRYAGVV